jgi:ribosome biogenesis GTPase
VKGTVIKSTGSWYKVVAEGVLYSARTRGKLRLDERDTSNPVAVGDLVTIEPDPQYPETAQITRIEPRRNYIVRKSNKLSSKRQVIASNIDLAIMVASVVAPRTSTGFIDRFLVCCEAFHIPAAIFFNKVDLLTEDGLEFLAAITQIYQQAGYTVLHGSAVNPDDVNEVRQFVQGKTVLFSGHSGVGKSTLLNSLYPNSAAKVGSISESHEKGKHTTTFAEMHLQEDGTKIIDTPGIRDFGVVDVPETEIGQYFPEFRKYSLQCKFNDCQHTNEPGCAIKESVENGNISDARYYSYRSILSGEDVFD